MANRYSTSRALPLPGPLARPPERGTHFSSRRQRPWFTHGVVAAVGTWTLLPLGAAATESSNFVLGAATALLTRSFDGGPPRRQATPMPLLGPSALTAR